MLSKDFVRRRPNPIAIGLIFLIMLAWLGYSFIATWRAIPDAYLACDAGTLIIEYLQTHDDQWPRSWEVIWTYLSDKANQ